MYIIINATTGQLVDEKSENPSQITSLSLKIDYDYQQLKKHLLSSSFKKEPLSAAKYKRLYPLVENDQLVTLQEGGTPLYKSEKISKKMGINHLYFKYEGLNPTGAFKDRGSLVEITKAKQYQAKAVVVASTGNMAASVSAYCAKADIPCYVFIPHDTPETKIAQILFYGPKIIKIKGAINDIPFSNRFKGPGLALKYLAIPQKNMHLTVFSLLI